MKSFYCTCGTALRCPQVEMACSEDCMTSQDLFSGAASATGNADSEGNDAVGGCFDGDSDASVND